VPCDLRVTMESLLASSEIPALLVVVGASGAGKTTLVSRLAALELPGVGCYYFDTIGIPAEGDRRFADGAAFQAWALDVWVARLARNEDRVRVAVLDASVRPTAVRDAMTRHGVMHGDVVLVDCEYAERNARLRGPRGQPELATPQMDCWAAYLRGQADALGLAVLDTTDISPDEGVYFLRERLAAILGSSA
jgi:energy-coupling factor transporter ATP-binding protein EcfA2